jgi:hypothetical protein
MGFHHERVLQQERKAVRRQEAWLLQRSSYHDISAELGMVSGIHDNVKISGRLIIAIP